MISDCFTKFGMIENEVRAFRATDEMSRKSEIRFAKSIHGPAALITRRFNVVNGIRQFVAEKKRIMVSAHENFI